MNIDPRLHRIIAAQPYQLLFATISGAHLYGFPSPDSDFDLRGAHVLPMEIVAGLDVRDETLEQSMIVPAEPGNTSSGLRPPSTEHFELDDTGNPLPASPPSPAIAGEGEQRAGRALLDMDIVSHDVRKFFKLLLRNNGYVLEQLYSPLIVHTTPEHAELKEIAKGCITRNHFHHYRGFLNNQWKLALKASDDSEEVNPRAKPVLYVLRVALTGIYLMRTGELNANLLELNEIYKLPYVANLIAVKQTGEQSRIGDDLMPTLLSEFKRLDEELSSAYEKSELPESVSSATWKAMNDLLVRIRVNGVTGESDTTGGIGGLIEQR